MSGSSDFQEAEFDLEFEPNYHITFQVCLPTNTKEVIVTVQDQTSTDVWKSQVDLGDLTGKVLIHLQLHLKQRKPDYTRG